jgi:hypothetical protein
MTAANDGLQMTATRSRGMNCAQECATGLGERAKQCEK